MLKINDVTNKIEKTVKFIGVIFDQGLTWAAHIDYITDRCKVRLNLMRAISGSTWGASRSILLIVYKALIRPSSTTKAWPTTVRQRKRRRSWTDFKERP